MADTSKRDDCINGWLDKIGVLEAADDQIVLSYGSEHILKRDFIPKLRWIHDSLSRGPFNTGEFCASCDWVDEKCRVFLKFLARNKVLSSGEDSDDEDKLNLAATNALEESGGDLVVLLCMKLDKDDDLNTDVIAVKRSDDDKIYGFDANKLCDKVASCVVDGIAGVVTAVDPESEESVWVSTELLRNELTMSAMSDGNCGLLFKIFDKENGCVFRTDSLRNVKIFLSGLAYGRNYY